MKHHKRVVVAMSGGVDSSVAALLLKKEGYEIIGISLKLWDYNESSRKENSKTCCSFEDINDAGAVCAQLDIPFYAFNYKKHFEENVILPFVQAYREGRTPNPCVLCNQHVKFDRLLMEAQKLGADYLATGHYARIKKDEGGIYRLLKGIDSAKDQSYVLFGLDQNILARTLLPIGDYTKEEIRKMARTQGLPTADKHESQDICFVPDNDYARFIQKNYPSTEMRKGAFIDEKGSVLGQHEGIHAYTVGQRRGLSVSHSERLYVTQIDSERNEIRLGPRSLTYRQGFTAGRVKWIVPDAPNDCFVKIRYQRNEIPVLWTAEGEADSVIVKFKEPHFGVTPGQAAVFYRNDEVLGGGWIENIL